MSRPRSWRLFLDGDVHLTHEDANANECDQESALGYACLDCRAPFSRSPAGSPSPPSEPALWWQGERAGAAFLDCRAPLSCCLVVRRSPPLAPVLSRDCRAKYERTGQGQLQPDGLTDPWMPQDLTARFFQNHVCDHDRDRVAGNCEKTADYQDGDHRDHHEQEMREH